MNNSTMIAIYLALVALGSSIWLVKTLITLRELRRRYSPIIDIEKQRFVLEAELAGFEEKSFQVRTKMENELAGFSAKSLEQRKSWEQEYSEAITELEELTKELDLARDDSMLQSFGLYEPQFDFESADVYKERLTTIRDEQKQMVRDGMAAVCSTEWKVEGSAAKGRRMTQRNLKLLLRAFNGESDAAVAKVKYNNVNALRERLRRSVEAINKLGEPNHCRLVTDYFDLKLNELLLAHEYQEKKQEEKEEQRRIREQMREEERALREAEKAKSDAEKEEKRYDEALEKARDELGGAEEKKRARLQGQIDELERCLREAKTNKERAESMAQLTKSGHVYVVSNIGSFGDDVFKIGMTRRLEPLDRVKELGDASVPFPFDVHAMIYSVDAPDLENKLHKEFESRRLNLINHRKEFFYVTLAEIEKATVSHGAEIKFTRVAEAEQYRKTIAVLEERKRDKPESVPVVVESARQRLNARLAAWRSEAPAVS